MCKPWPRAVAIGQLAEPAVAISSVSQGVGPGNPSTFHFTVSLTGTPSPDEPVSISYATVDGSATAANGDYTPVSGTLTWAAVDTSPRTISVPVTDVMPASDEFFLVELSKPSGHRGPGGQRLRRDPVLCRIATTTSLAASTLSTPGQASVTLTTVVTNQDASSSPGTGQVTFYDGSTALGTATLDATGTASLTTSFSGLGSHTLTVGYSGYQEIGAIYDSSISPAVMETVTPAIQTITFASVPAQTYGDIPFSVEAESSLYLPVSLSVISGPATLDGDVLSITGAGTIVVEATQSGDSFTAAATPVDLSIPVAPAPLFIAATNLTATYGGAYPTFAVAYSGFVSGDTAASLTTLPTLTTPPAGSGAGTYAVDVSGAVDPNYTITYIPGSLTITPAPLTVLPASETAVYGAAYPTLAATLAGAIGSDLATLESELSLSTAPAGSAVGAFDIAASGITDPNYNVNYGTATLTITPAPLIITANSLSATYGAVPAGTASYSGLENGDTALSLTAQPIQITSPAGSSVGTYTITPTGAVDANYTISYVSGTLTITPAALTITANDQTINFGVPIPTLTASYSGLAGGDSPASLSVPPTLSLATSATDAGSYAIDIFGAVDANYVITYVPGTLLINPDETTTTIASLLTGPSGNQDSIITATVIADSTGLPVTTGSVQFQLDGQDFGDPVSLDADGEATFDPGILAVGQHTITATFAGTNDFQASNQSLYEVVYEYQTTTQLSQSESVATYGDLVTFTANVAALGSSSPTPTGSVQFEVDGQPSGAPVALDDTGTASLSLSTIDAGTHTITAIYESEDSTFESGEASTMLVVMPSSQTINFGPLTSVSYGVAPIVLDASASSGLAVAYSIISGPGTLDGSTLTITGAGTITIEADQAGDDDYLTASSVQQSLQVAPAILTVTANPETKVYGSSDPALAYTVSGLKYNDTAASVLSGSLTRTLGETVSGSPYAITLGTLAADTSYTINFAGIV